MKLAILLSIIMLGCSTIPNEIAFGEDQCVYCRMTISNPKYGALLVTEKGRVRKYDATECMINDLHENEIVYQKLLVIANDQPKKLIEAESSYFVISEVYKSPMGANLAAFESLGSVADSLESMQWSQVKQTLLTK